jgi:hypothetical protein
MKAIVLRLSICSIRCGVQSTSCKASNGLMSIKKPGSLRVCRRFAALACIHYENSIPRRLSAKLSKYIAETLKTSSWPKCSPDHPITSNHRSPPLGSRRPNSLLPNKRTRKSNRSISCQRLVSNSTTLMPLGVSWITCTVRWGQTRSRRFCPSRRRCQRRGRARSSSFR